MEAQMKTNPSGGTATRHLQLNFKNHCIFCLQPQQLSVFSDILKRNPKNLRNFQPLLHYLTGTDPTAEFSKRICAEKKIPAMNSLPPVCYQCYDMLGELYRLHEQLQKVQTLIQRQTELIRGRVTMTNTNPPENSSRFKFRDRIKASGMEEAQVEMVFGFVKNLHDKIIAEGLNTVLFPSKLPPDYVPEPDLSVSSFDKEIASSLKNPLSAKPPSSVHKPSSSFGLLKNAMASGTSKKSKCVPEIHEPSSDEEDNFEDSPASSEKGDEDEHLDDKEDPLALSEEEKEVEDELEVKIEPKESQTLEVEPPKKKKYPRKFKNAHVPLPSAKPFKCTQRRCGRCFDSLKELREHKARSHASSKSRLKCEHCENTYSMPAALKKHIRIVHLGIRLVCPICGDRFTCNQTLATHQLIHSGEKPFACPTCGQAFRHKHVMVQHWRNVHV